MIDRLRPAIVILVLVLLASALSACAGSRVDDQDSPSASDDDTGDDDDDDDAADPSACDRAVVTSGFGLRWKRVNHRLSLWSIAPETAGCPQTVPDDVALSVGMIGGPWSTGRVATDAPSAAYEYFATTTGGAAAFAFVDVPITIDAPNDTGNGETRIAAADVGLADRETYVAVLAGLTLNTAVSQVDPDYPADYDPAYGYTSRGIGAGIEEPVIEDGAIRVSAWARFEHGPADRSDMNEAMAHARTEAVVHVLLIGVDGGAAATVDHAYRIDYRPPWPLFQPEYDHAPLDLRRTSVDGAPGLPVALAALRSFDFRLFGSVEEGDYMREFAVAARILSYDAETGRAELDVEGYASNVGLLTYETMENDFTAGVALIQLPGGSAVPGVLSAEFETGETVLDLP